MVTAMRPVPAPQLQDLSTRFGQYVGALPCHAAAEKIGHLGRGYEITACANLYTACTVIAEARSVERQLHELLEGEPPPRRNELLPDQGLGSCAVAFLVGR